MLDLKHGIGLEQFLQRLAETIDWCAPRAALHDLRGCLRTPDLAPEPLAGSRRKVVESVADRRRFALQLPPARMATSLAGGRLLGYVPDHNTSDWAAKDETGGFVDGDNVPPWDTWVGYVYEAEQCQYLVSWVPLCFVEIMTRGLRVNSDECIWWLDERETELASLLRGRGML